MKRATWSQLLGRVLLLLFGSALIDRLIISRLPGLSLQQGQLVLVLLMVFVAWMYVLPLFAELVNSSPQDADAPRRQGTSDTEVGQVAHAASQTKVIVAVGIITLLVWIGVSSIAPVEWQHEGTIAGALEAGVMVTTMIAVAAILLMRIAGLSQRGLRVVMVTNPALLVVMLIAAIGWWLAPAIVIVVSLGQFSAHHYLEAILPVTYIFFPAAALALRKYRGR